METLSSTFSSLGFKKEKTFVGKEQKFVYVSKVPRPKSYNMLKNDMNEAPSESSSKGSKIPISSSGDGIIDFDASSFENT